MCPHTKSFLNGSSTFSPDTSLSKVGNITVHSIWRLNSCILHPLQYLQEFLFLFFKRRKLKLYEPSVYKHLSKILKQESLHGVVWLQLSLQKQAKRRINCPTTVMFIMPMKEKEAITYNHAKLPVSPHDVRLAMVEQIRSKNKGSYWMVKVLILNCYIFTSLNAKVKIFTTI